MRRLSLILSTLLFISTASVSVAALLPEKKSTPVDTLKMLDLFGDVFEKVKKDYVEEVSDKDLIEAALNGMLTSLDPHSSYLNEKAFDEMKVQTKGEFGGLGIEVTMENGLVKVVSPIDDTPAFVAGIKAGDFISYIDDEAIMGMTLAEAVTKMRGKVGTSIRLTVLREGAPEPIEYSITRDVIKIKSVRGHAQGDIGYIRITSFSEQTGTSLKNELNVLKKEIGPNLKGYVLDLRNNPGGLLDQAIEVADTFLEQGEIVSTRGRLPDSTSRFTASAGDVTGGLPIVILINGGSASASEIVAGALKDHKRAIVMGTKSFGKGSVQTVIPLAQHGAMRLTTSRYYTPSGKSIQAEGIVPDIAVDAAKLEPLDSAAAKDSKKFYSEANLRKHLSGDKKPAATGEKAAPEKAPEAPSNKDDAKDKGAADQDKDNKDKKKDKKQLAAKTEEQQLYDKDYQLARALDLLRGIYIYRKVESR
jgi:carboxyl-terminal processing protease